MDEEDSVQGLMVRVVHELRSPLAVMNGYLSMILDGTFDVPFETREGPIRVLASKAQEMDMLIETLAASVRGVASTAPQQPQEFDAASAVRHAVARVEGRARLEGARVEVQAASRNGSMVWASRPDVACVLTNLLHNALSYSPRPSSVLIEVRPGDPVEVAVYDHGEGVPAGQEESIFRPFVRASRSVPGLGIGLPVSREMAERNGGSLVLEWTEEGRGSVFVLRLPSSDSMRKTA
jgi:signal transduction histidine kinase